MTHPPTNPPAQPSARPPLYARRPFLAGLLRQLPLLAVLIAVGIGLFLTALDHWRWGLVVVGLATVGGAVLRLLLPVRRVGFLAVRSRLVDVLFMTVAGLAMVVIAIAVPG